MSGFISVILVIVAILLWGFAIENLGDVVSAWSNRDSPLALLVRFIIKVGAFFFAVFFIYQVGFDRGIKSADED